MSHSVNDFLGTALGFRDRPLSLKLRQGFGPKETKILVKIQNRICLWEKHSYLVAGDNLKWYLLNKLQVPHTTLNIVEDWIGAWIN